MKRKIWTDKELEYLKSNWGKISLSDIARNLSVSRTVIYNQAKIMNLPKLGNFTNIKWTDEEIEKLRELASKKTISQLAKYFDTTNSAISTIAGRNGIILKDGKVKWSETEEELLRKLAKEFNVKEISIKMNKSISAIRLYAKRNNIDLLINDKNNNLFTDKEWSINEIEELKLLALEKTLSELSNWFQCSKDSIKKVAKDNKIKLISDKRRWNDDEYALLEKLIIDKKTPIEIAKILKRSEDAITLKISQLGLTNKKYWTREEEIILEDLWGIKSLEIISKRLNRTIPAITNKAFQLGLGSMKENNYDGLTINEISQLLDINFETINIGWVALGLRYKTKKLTNSKSYRYVEINDLYEFLKANQNLWNSKKLEKNILGIEPEWLKEKRIRDKDENFSEERLYLTKQQLITTKNILLELQKEENLELKANNKTLTKKKTK